MSALPGSFEGNYLKSFNQNPFLTRNAGPPPIRDAGCCGCNTSCSDGVSLSPVSDGYYLIQLGGFSGGLEEVNGSYRVYTCNGPHLSAANENRHTLTSGRTLRLDLCWRENEGWSVEIEVTNLDTTNWRWVALMGNTYTGKYVYGRENCFWKWIGAGPPDPLADNDYGPGYAATGENNFIPSELGYATLSKGEGCSHKADSVWTKACSYPDTMQISGSGFVDIWGLRIGDLFSDAHNTVPGCRLFDWYIAGWALDKPPCNFGNGYYICSDDSDPYAPLTCGALGDNWNCHKIAMSRLNGTHTLKRTSLFRWEEEDYPAYDPEVWIDRYDICPKHALPEIEFQHPTFYPGLVFDIIPPTCPGRPIYAVISLQWHRDLYEDSLRYHAYVMPPGYYNVAYDNCQGIPNCVPSYTEVWPLSAPQSPESPFSSIFCLTYYQYVGIMEHTNERCLPCDYGYSGVPYPTDTMKWGYVNCGDWTRYSWGPLARLEKV